MNARLAADAVGCHQMDRPGGARSRQWRDHYADQINSNRSVDPSGSSRWPDAANPRAYTDMKAPARKGQSQRPSTRMKEGAAGSAATSFTWDVYAFGAQADAGWLQGQRTSLGRGDQDFGPAQTAWPSQPRHGYPVSARPTTAPTPM